MRRMDVRSTATTCSACSASRSKPGGTVTLYLDGDQVGEGRVEATVPLIFSGDETADVGRDTASPVSDDYEGESSVFTGTVNWVQIDLGEDAEDADHLITPEERLSVAMARQ